LFLFLFLFLRQVTKRVASTSPLLDKDEDEPTTTKKRKEDVYFYFFSCELFLNVISPSSSSSPLFHQVWILSQVCKPWSEHLDSIELWSELGEEDLAKDVISFQNEEVEVAEDTKSTKSLKKSF
jgi:hypothetical protein